MAPQVYTSGSFYPVCRGPKGGLFIFSSDGKTKDITKLPVSDKKHPNNTAVFGSAPAYEIKPSFVARMRDVPTCGRTKRSTAVGTMEEKKTQAPAETWVLREIEDLRHRVSKLEALAQTALTQRGVEGGDSKETPTESEASCDSCAEVILGKAPKKTIEVCKPRCMRRCAMALGKLLQTVSYFRISLQNLHEMGATAVDLQVKANFSLSSSSDWQIRVFLYLSDMSMAEATAVQGSGRVWWNDISIAKKMAKLVGPHLAAYSTRKGLIEYRPSDTRAAVLDSSLLQALCNIIWYFGYTKASANMSIQPPENVYYVWKAYQIIQPRGTFSAVIPRDMDEPQRAKTIKTLRETGVPFLEMV